MSTNYQYRQYYYLDFTGVKFSPTQAEKQTKLRFYEKIEPDELAYYRSKNHSEYGKPSKVGAAKLQAPLMVKNQQSWLLKALQSHVSTLRKIGADDITFWELFYVEPDGQKNFSLGTDALKILSDSKTPYCMSIYDCEVEEIQSMSTRYCSKFFKNDPK